MYLSHMIHSGQILRNATPAVLGEEAVGGKMFSEEAQEASNKMNRFGNQTLNYMY